MVLEQSTLNWHGSGEKQSQGTRPVIIQGCTNQHGWSFFFFFFNHSWNDCFCIDSCLFENLHISSIVAWKVIRAQIHGYHKDCEFNCVYLMHSNCFRKWFQNSDNNNLPTNIVTDHHSKSILWHMHVMGHKKAGSCLSVDELGFFF